MCTVVKTIADHKAVADICLPNSASEFINKQIGDQSDENCNAFKRYIIRPYMISPKLSHMNLSITILGHRISFPVSIAPMGAQNIVHPKAEYVTATAACKEGIGFGMSAWSSTTMEDLVLNTMTGLKFLNMYMYRKRWWSTHLAERAERAGFHGIILGLVKSSPRVSGGKHLRGLRYANLEKLTSAVSSDDPDYPLGDPTVTWEDLAWLKSVTKLPIVVKGITTGRDAMEAVRCGADGILVSNHGGRQLSSTAGTVDCLSEVVQAVAGRCEVFLDGGVRSGADIFKALALGARAVFIGRPILWGMAHSGEQGVRDVIQLLRDELLGTMTRAGVADVSDIPSDAVIPKHRVALL